MRLWLGAVWLAVLPLLGGAEPPAPAAGVEPTVVRIEKYTFIPAEITVPAGTTVRWLNAEKRTSHSVWFETEGLEESPRLFPGEVFERTFDQTGRHEYRCGPHEEMHGVVIVVPR